ncbi:CDP-glycerol--UDP-pyrophosphoryl-N-acetylglucosaminyl-N-acetylmannosamine glycerophosphotransferase [Enterococcus sp. JM4C]|uniref:CDP-glycerol glycerophosphotransferase family protein n=1 Tax=Candidatus Enterococcus huntleyi TaxID=1857217 RepID=UPI00137B8870|nr:CDP-glycerol glycerophosphotransferase family protein [Enterococcus sp. JM4C]KAF1297230.1 CDP-glycerol--UDP-pyrophosphoryl-N-acetylglucosaminyl-N-acetylmannosamine glycerophosphotransferase [Enterococcus sp. JM4C]
MKDGFLSLIKSSYLLLVQAKAKSSRVTHDKIVYLLSFPSTSEPVLEELSAYFGSRLVICYTANSFSLAQKFQSKGSTIYSIDRFSELFTQVVPLVKGASTVLCDNYFAFLGAIDFAPTTEVIQLWHANGAIKKFGIEANYAKNRSASDKKRYKKVYKKYTHYAVGSDKMGTIFQESYLATSDQLLKIGYPTSDHLLSSSWRRQQEARFSEVFSDLAKKRIVLYTPTYREKTSENPLDFERLANELGDEWVIFAKAHPHDEQLQERLATSMSISSDMRGFTLQEFLPFVDCLITDYSSVPFEYTLVKDNGKILFFCYDMDSYQKEVGIQEDFESWIPSTIVQTQKQLTKEIVSAEPQEIEAFNSLWNQYNDGQATQRLIKRIEEKI